MSRCEGLAFRALGSPGQALHGRGGVGYPLWVRRVPRPPARRRHAYCLLPYRRRSLPASQPTSPPSTIPASGANGTSVVTLTTTPTAKPSKAPSAILVPRLTCVSLGFAPGTTATPDGSSTRSRTFGEGKLHAAGPHVFERLASRSAPGEELAEHGGRGAASA